MVACSMIEGGSTRSGARLNRLGGSWIQPGGWPNLWSAVGGPDQACPIAPSTSASVMTPQKGAPRD
jgi:hypothetical protein